MARSATPGRTVAPDPVNEVRLVGRVPGPAEVTVLPSGDEVVQWRVVVPRTDPRSSGPRVDTIDCAAWTSALRTRALRLSEGDHVEVTGPLRRRFWRTPAGAASRYEVEVRTVRRVTAPARA